jgi:hypothetical protein
VFEDGADYLMRSGHGGRMGVRFRFNGSREYKVIVSIRMIE